MIRSGWFRVVLASGFAAAAAAMFEPWLAPLAGLCLLLVLSPLARRKRIWFVGDVETEYAIVSRRREEALRALKDLDEDRQAGKIPASEAEQQRAALLQTAKEVTSQLDAILQKRNAARQKIEAALGDSEKA